MEASALEILIPRGERRIKCLIALPKSSLHLDSLIEIWLDFTGRENALWQLKNYVEEKIIPSLLGTDECAESEDYDFFNYLFDLEDWAKNRNIPCVLTIHGWGIKSIICRVLRASHNCLKNHGDSNFNTPAT